MYGKECMNILVMGASSKLGQVLVREFAANNVLLLTGRNVSRLQSAKKDAENSGAVKVIVVEHDFEKGIDRLITGVKGYRIDLLINTVSATSRLRDSAIDPKKIEFYTHSDLITPVKFVEYLVENHEVNYQRDSPLRIIFVSSMLAAVKSPDRDIYSSYKILQESFLKRIQTIHKHRVQLTIVRIGVLLNRKEITIHHVKIAKKVVRLYKEKNMIFYGLKGRIVTWLYHVSPFIMRVVIYVARVLRTYILRSKSG